MTTENTYGKYAACRLCAAMGASGKTVSAERKAKLSAALKGRTFSAETLTKMRKPKRTSGPRPRYRCGNCEFEASGRWLVPHQRKTGHTGRIPLQDIA